METVLLTFGDTLSIAFVILLHIITEVSGILQKYIPFSQIHMLGFELQSFLHVRYFLHSH